MAGGNIRGIRHGIYEANSGLIMSKTALSGTAVHSDGRSFVKAAKTYYNDSELVATFPPTINFEGKPLQPTEAFGGYVGNVMGVVRQFGPSE